MPGHGHQRAALQHLIRAPRTPIAAPATALSALSCTWNSRPADPTSQRGWLPPSSAPLPVITLASFALDTLASSQFPAHAGYVPALQTQQVLSLPRGPKYPPPPRPLPPRPSSLYLDIIPVRPSLATASKVVNVPQYFLSFCFSSYRVFNT